MGRSPRAIVLVLDSVGVGELPDADEYGDAGSNTLANTAAAVGGLTLPNLGAMGIGNITDVSGVPPTSTPRASWGRNAEASAGKDTTTGHWEMMGLTLASAFPTYPDGFPPDVMAAFERETGLGWLGNYPASGTVIIQELGDEHVATGKPIIYTSADSVFQIAAHEEVIGIEELYRICKIARERVCIGEHAVGRVIARPFVGPDDSGTYTRTHRRRDFAVAPFEPTVLDVLAGQGIVSYGIGKIGEIFAWRGICESPHSENNMHGVDNLVKRVADDDGQRIRLCQSRRLRHGVGSSQRCRRLRARAGGGRRAHSRAARRDDRRRSAHHHGGSRMRSDDTVHGPFSRVHSADRVREGCRSWCRARHASDVQRHRGVGAGLLRACRAVRSRHELPGRGARGVSVETTIEELIERKRDGHAHSAEELERIIHGYTDGEIPDYQMAAWLMAALLNGLGPDETVWMTDAMVRSGRQVDLSSIPGVKVDKHSTGGVADTTTLVLAPLVAACGVPVAKMSGRGLGFTGGTLDKLESIPGYSIELSPEQFVAQVRDVGIAVIAQSPDVDPADKKIYALRDVTATVPSIPLIVGSIISKKIAGGADAVLLDVKVGSGAFMKTEQDARALARELVRVGAVLGREIVCVMTDMSQPLGMAVGNVLEVREAIETLRGDGPIALSELCVALGAKMLVMGEVCESESERPSALCVCDSRRERPRALSALDRSARR